MAGKGGLNLTHAEAQGAFRARYGARRPNIEALLNGFDADAVRAWSRDLGVETFVGSSGRVFPIGMKAAPLFRAWLHRLREAGVKMHVRHRWTGWSEHFRSKFAGHPLKSVVASVTDSSGRTHTRQGECIVTDTGIEGGLVYALSAPLRDEIAAQGAAVIHLDLLPGRDSLRVLEEIARPCGAKSLSTHLQSRLGIKGVKAGLLREVLPKQDFADPARIAEVLKALPLKLVAPRPIDEAISTAGGVAFEALDDDLMIRTLAGVFCAGEMLDWEAPTGGYLLSACFASGRAAGTGALAWFDGQRLRTANSPADT